MSRAKYGPVVVIRHGLYTRVLCPTCEARLLPLGRGGPLEPVGGTVYGRDVLGDIEARSLSAYACACWVGQRKAESVGTRSFVRAPNDVQWVTRPLAIQWTEGDSRPEPRGEAPRNDRLATACEKQLARFNDGEIDATQLAANIQALEAREQGGSSGPSIDDLRKSTDLRALYCPGTPPAGMSTEPPDERLPYRE